jgi:hypothetical protein
MQRFSAWARWIGTIIFTSVFIPVAVHFIEQQPQETTNVVLKFLFYLGEQAWLRITALILLGFVAGLWVDWLLRKLDKTRDDERKVLGGEMANFGETLALIKDLRQHTPKIISYFISARKFGIWAPDDRIFSILTDRLKSAIRENGSYMTPTKSVLDYMTLEDMIKDYLKQVGTMLRDGHFREARQYAINSKATFDGLS